MDIFSGIFPLPWWGALLIALAFTHVTIVAVTIYLHRHITHRAVLLHPVVAHFFRFWLWLTTGMVTREWEAVHKKHHQKCETDEDPHSPEAQMHALGVRGAWGRLFFMFRFVVWRGVRSYVRWTNQHTDDVERLGVNAPRDRLERLLYARHTKLGLALMGTANIVLFGLAAGSCIWVVQMLWIPVFAAGVVNGIGHIWGYRNYTLPNFSRNILPWGILIGGEELHNNHHEDAASAKFSRKWWELDVGWCYIRVMEFFRLAEVKNISGR
ncbi:MAG: fatty acid desaturase [Candidatus Lloydbacteria bacterium RIFCSPLOWO2_01_FULL_50_20]|uniref:Fatty acid desaturase n=1 Tax=Candidatus Lloydbacteria bacterium RIFCSPLOWO2_01_FULL_50_20 TaxID=1798665 RepID=A0A1G2DE31_9BACT|nr:MAG: fatty acid desaturase [Candidatus Lloydbacteria bacterium RIFCSPHIGHO2_02_FULL_50_11]OGZ11712.1 MAG: fatty acid desaturase [Candidatus Lloydbacteria bacterium RIFCSPLOWO2_01_FULL_50_20]